MAILKAEETHVINNGDGTVTSFANVNTGTGKGQVFMFKKFGDQYYRQFLYPDHIEMTRVILNPVQGEEQSSLSGNVIAILKPKKRPYKPSKIE